MFRFSWRKQEYVIPIMLILKALVGASDKEIFEGIVMEDYENTFLTDRVELLLRSFKTYKLYTGEQCLDFLGSKFRVVLGMPEDWDNAGLGYWIIKKLVLVHLNEPRDKFRMIMYVSRMTEKRVRLTLLCRFMLRKLFSSVSSSSCADNPDSPQHQEVLLPGYLYGMIIKEKIEDVLAGIRFQIALDVRQGNVAVNFFDSLSISSFTSTSK